MSPELRQLILSQTNANDISDVEVVQELWSGYGQLIRVYLSGADVDSIIVKNIDLSGNLDHPRGWNTPTSFDRKQKSYKIEQRWYEQYGNQCTNECRIPSLIYTASRGSSTVLMLEDLNIDGFSLRKMELSLDEVKLCLDWLANFHALFMSDEPDGLWSVGTYWHLSTRTNEFQAMLDSNLKEAAHEIDIALNSCSHRTFVHGDAKVANFCFHENGKGVAAVDFQYVGGGCGMKDVAYFLGSCLDEKNLFLTESELLTFYFSALKNRLKKLRPNISFVELEKEWRLLYPICWSDFSRFLNGWMPNHSKLNGYSKEMIDLTLKRLG